MVLPKQTKLDDFDGCQTTLEEYVVLFEPEELLDEIDEIDCSWEQVYRSNRVK